jgi:ribonuclease HI
MYSRLASNVQAWQNIGANTTTIDWILNGVTLDLCEQPVPFELQNRKFEVHEETFIDEEVERLLAAGSIRATDQKPICISPLSVVPKKGNKLRLVTDLRKVNQYINTPYFRNEDIEVASKYIQSGDSMISIDLKNGYHHIPINTAFQQYLGFAWRNKHYVWQVCPFGLSSSGYYFNKIVRAVVQFLRLQGLRIVFFVDDGLLIAKRSEVTDQCDTLVHTFEELGFIIHYDKSHLVPTTRTEWIGYIIDSSGKNVPWIYIPRSRINKLRHDMRRIIARPQVGIKARHLARITGQCISMCKAILPAKLKLRNLYKILRARRSWHDVLYMDTTALDDLVWWYEALDKGQWNGAPISHKDIDIQLETDASGHGWGAVCQGRQAAGVWDKTTSLKSSNYRELLAIILAIKSFAQCLKNKKVQVLTDNISCVAYINQLGGPSSELSRLAEALWAQTHELNINLSAKHIAGKLNVHADFLSRIMSPHEWKLHPNMFSYIDRLFGPHTVDRFASLRTTQLHRYNSRWWDPATEGIDAMAQTWTGENNYVNPPFKMIPHILDKVRNEGITATLIAPDWPAQPWYRTLCNMTTHTIALPNSPRCIMRMGVVPEPQRNRKWRLFAWRICGLNN